MPAASDTLVVAGISARIMAESARQGGWRVVALDLFGDLDTRRASAWWAPIGDPATLAVDPDLLGAALAGAAGEPGIAGWVAGGGFEGAPELLGAAPPRVPHLGMGPAQVRAVRDPWQFFPALDRLGLMHPPVCRDPPPDPAGWLAKRAGGTGGWHIRDAADAGPAHPDTYYQRHQPGVPMSALFIADGEAASLIALNHLIARPIGAHPHVYHGAIGPVHDAALEASVQAALAALVPTFALRGLASLDFIALDGTPWILEVNPRPPASMALHAQAWPAGLMRAHVAAMRGHLPAARSRVGVRGSQVVYATRACVVDADEAAALARVPHCHDIPAAGACYAAGNPVCSVSAAGDDPASVARTLDERTAAIQARLRACSA